MEKKAFISRLFNRKVLETEKDYWAFLYAETLFRINQIDDLNCPCSKCYSDKIRFIHLIETIHWDDHIPPNPKPLNFTGKGDCGRSK